MADTWTPIDDSTAFQDDAVFEIDKTTKNIQVLVEQPIVAGENKSQFIKFQMGRYYDAIDLTQMEVNILYESPTGYQDISSAVNREYSDEYIRFGWLVPYSACSEKGKLSFAVEFVGEDYVLKTTKSTTDVLDSIAGSSSVPEPVEQTWYIELQSQVAAAINNANSTLEAVTEIVETFQGDIGEAISDWLDEHPEATTTVQDGAITEAKLASALKLKTLKDYVTPEMYGAKGDGVTDDTEAIQSAIDSNPNKNIVFSKIYVVSSPIITSADENKKVFLKLDSGAVIKASDDFTGDFVIDIGGKDTRASIYDTLYITGIDGGTIDTNGVCGGVLVERTQMGRITNLSIINVGAYVGLRIDKPSEENDVNSSDAYIENLVVTGENSNVESCTGLIINGHDNDIRNIRTNFVNIGIVINGSHNRISNAHPLRGASDTDNNYAVYDTSRAFVVNNNHAYLTNCYSDNFAVGIEVKAGCIFFAYGFTLLWYENYAVTHTFIKIVDDGETQASTKLFWGHIVRGDLLFKSVGTNKGIDGDFLVDSYARNAGCFSDLYINNKATLSASDPLLDRRFSTNKVIDYNYDATTIETLDQIGEGTSGRVNFSANASPTGTAGIYIYSCVGDSTRKQITVISPSNNVVYTNIYNGSWGQWKTYQFNNGFTTPESTDAITDLSTIRCGEMGRARFDASVSPTSQSGVFIYECIGGDESRKILIAYFPSNKNRYINSYTGSWTGWATM